MTRSILATAAIGAAILAASAAHADTVVVTPTAPAGWSTPPGDNSGGGSSTITNTAPRSGNGSLEMFGDRTRFELGNLVSLQTVTSLTYDWRIAGDSVAALNPDYTPALRLNIFDGGQFSSLVWEGAYNGLYGTVDPDIWYSTSASSTFYKRVVGGPCCTENTEKTVTDWLSSYSANAVVYSISVGVGSSAGGGYHAFADNVTLATTTGSRTWNFETSATPEPATWAMMLIGFGGLGAVMRRARRNGLAATA